MQAHINPNIFLFFSIEGTILWDFENHNQYSLSPQYSSRLAEIACTRCFAPHENPIDSELKKNNIISDEAFPQSEWGWDILSRIFHVGTKNIPQDFIPKDGRDWALRYAAFCLDTTQRDIPPYRRRESSLCIRLPNPNTRFLETRSLWKTLIERRTCRKFERREVSLDTLSTILYSSFGFLNERESGINEFVPSYLRQRRSSPSGGGLNSAEIYVWSRQVQSLVPGIYHYGPTDHNLTFISGIDQSDSLATLLMGQYFSEDLAFGAFIASRFDRMWWKYSHSRAYRVSLLDIGHLSQTFQIVSTAFGLGTWLSAAFLDSEVERLLNITTLDEQVLLFVGAGYSNGDDVDVESRHVLSQYLTINPDETSSHLQLPSHSFRSISDKANSSLHGIRILLYERSLIAMIAA